MTRFITLHPSAEAAALLGAVAEGCAPAFRRPGIQDSVTSLDKSVASLGSDTHAARRPTPAGRKGEVA